MTENGTAHASARAMRLAIGKKLGQGVSGGHEPPSWESFPPGQGGNRSRRRNLADRADFTEMRTIADRIKERLAAVGLSESEASRLAGSDESLIRKLRKGGHSPRADTLLKLAQVLKCSVEFLLQDDAEVGASPFAQGLPIRFRVQAGLWIETDDFDDGGRDAVLGYAPLLPLTRFSIADQWGELVVGDSVDRLYPDGSVLHVVSWAASGMAPAPGPLVVVERRKPGLTQRTVKRLAARDGSLVLIGQSTNDRWNKPLDFSDLHPEAETVSIVGHVVGGYVKSPED